jgi:NADH:ubiquinone oxidoreductase subunit 5 (subunit L)/multisubunit Na+/H+ antiporter MnhA subunit
MPQFLQYFIWLPLAGFLLTLLIPRKNERMISAISIALVTVQLIGILSFITIWLLNGHPLLDRKHMVLFNAPDFQIFIDFFFDKITAVFAAVGALLAVLVMIFSKYYLHREEGFKRYFCTLLLFYTGYNVIIFSGNFETLFFGWEVLGISSFLLIAFYRDRYLPVKNGLKVIALYRLSDACLLLAMWLSHHLWHENITFLKLQDSQLVQQQLQQYGAMGMMIAVLVLIAAAAKSAQLPFSSWLPRAMEGPTSSSAIFYGSLAVHIGVFLLLRTYPFWESMATIKIAVIVVGVLTAIVASTIASVQSTVKTQIAYSSVAQIGLIFIEVALGFHVLALIHFAGNAFLRTYQLLVSPSVLSYLVHDQFYNFNPAAIIHKQPAFHKIRNAVYMLSVKEWNIDFLLQRFLWNPFKTTGKRVAFVTHRVVLIFIGLIFLSGIYAFNIRASLPVEIVPVLPVIFSLTSLLFILNAFTERIHTKRAWILIFVSQLFMALAISLNGQFGLNEVLLFLSGTVVSGIAGYICLIKLEARGEAIDLNGFHGHLYEQPTLAFIFLLSCLGMLGFPITPTFIGLDVLFSHIRPDQYALIIFAALGFIFIELSVLRIYARIFLGQHKKAYHPIAYRSS